MKKILAIVLVLAMLLPLVGTMGTKAAAEAEDRSRRKTWGPDL